MPIKKKAKKVGTKLKKAATNPLSKIPASIRQSMRLQAGYREREILSHAKKITIQGDNIKIDTGRKTGSPTDSGVFNVKRRAWTN